MVESILSMAGLDWPVPDFSTLSRRQKRISVQISNRRSPGPLNLLVDSTGIKFLGGVYDGKDTGAVKADKLAARLETLEPGLWLQIDHGSTNDPEMQAIGHLGYEWVAADRAANVEMWTSPKVREAIERRKIKLISYRDLRQ